MLPGFGFDLLPARARRVGYAVGRGMGVDEVAPLAVHAVSHFEVDAAFLGLVFGVELVVFAELVGAVCEFALLFVGAEPEFQVFFAQLRFLLILPYGRFARILCCLISRRGRPRGRHRTVHPFLLESGV